MIVTVLVAIVGVLYLLWSLDATLPGISGASATGVAVLAVGLAASAGVVVSSFDQLLHGNNVYLVMTSLIALVAVIGGVQMLLTASGTKIAVVMAAMALLWAIATVYHSLLASTATGSNAAQDTRRQNPGTPARTDHDPARRPHVPGLLPPVPMRSAVSVWEVRGSGVA